MAQRFKPIVIRSKFVAAEYGPQRMNEIGDGVLESILERWDQAVDMFLAPAPPLSDSYAKYKTRRGKRGIRDWNFRGIMRRSMKTLRVKNGEAVIGPIQDAVTYTLRKKNGRARPMLVLDVLRIQNRKSRLWGMSPNDKKAFLRLVLNRAKVVKATKSA